MPLLAVLQDVPVGEPLTGVGDVVKAHWAKYGRHHTQRHDYEGVDTVSAGKLVAGLVEGFEELADKEFGAAEDGGALFKVATADEFSCEQPPPPPPPFSLFPLVCSCVSVPTPPRSPAFSRVPAPLALTFRRCRHEPGERRRGVRAPRRAVDRRGRLKDHLPTGRRDPRDHHTSGACLGRGSADTCRGHSNSS